MSKVIMTCGLICCGKSTYAKKLQAEQNGIILSVDDITLALFHRTILCIPQLLNCLNYDICLFLSHQLLHKYLDLLKLCNPL